MTTKTKKIMPLLIISLLTLSIATLTSIQAASASNAGLIFTPNYNVDDCTVESSSCKIICQFPVSLFLF